MKYSIFLTQTFRGSFAGRFDADVIDLDDPDDIRRQAQGCIASLAVQANVDFNALLNDLRSFLGTWERKTLLELTEWTNLEWTDSPEMENSLRQIMDELIRALEEKVNQDGKRKDLR